MEKKELGMIISETGGRYKMNVRLKLTDKIDVCFIAPLDFTRGCIGNEIISIANIELFRKLSKALYEALVEGVKNSDNDNPDFQRIKELFRVGIIE